MYECSFPQHKKNIFIDLGHYYFIQEADNTFFMALIDGEKRIYKYISL